MSTGFAVLAKRWDITKELAALFEHTKTMPRGTLIEHAEIERVTGIKRGPLPWGLLIPKWKKKVFRELHIYVKSVKGVGYKFTTVTEQRVEESERLDQAADRKRKEACKVVAVIPLAELDEEGRAFQAARAEQLASQLAVSRADRAKARCWLSSPETLPRAIANGNGKKIT